MYLICQNELGYGVSFNFSLAQKNNLFCSIRLGADFPKL